MFMDYLEVEEDHGNRGCSSQVVVDSHGIHVSFGGFTLAEVEDIGIKVHGYEKLEEQLNAEVEKVRHQYKLLIDSIHNEERKSGDIPKESVVKLRSMIIQIALKFFAKHPDRFEKWLQEQLDKKHQEGRELQANKICEALNVGGYFDSNSEYLGD